MNACAPVLFLVFNRPEQTGRVFEAIRAARPHRLYVAADGPRPDRAGESERCAEVRTIATAVDWPCELQTRFHDHNLGCRDAVASSIGWFFQAEPQGIVLEDDCLPSPEFFAYATALLDYYADDARVMKINGFNPFGSCASTGSYFYSYFGFAWGWASWRRVWRYFDADVTLLAKQLSSQALLPYPFYKGRLDVIEDLVSGLDTWDFQLEFAISAQHGLQIIPSKSLIHNIGFGPEASHTQKPPRGIQTSFDFSTVFPIVHPTLMLPDVGYERRLIDLGRPSIWDRLRSVAKHRLMGLIESK
jgi:hypothetical protein